MMEGHAKKKTPDLLRFMLEDPFRDNHTNAYLDTNVSY